MNSSFSLPFLLYVSFNSFVSILRKISVLLFLTTDYCPVCLLQRSVITYESSFSPQWLEKRTGKGGAECNQKLCLLNQVWDWAVFGGQLSHGDSGFVLVLWEELVFMFIWSLSYLYQPKCLGTANWFPSRSFCCSFIMWTYLNILALCTCSWGGLGGRKKLQRLWEHAG